MALSEPDGPRHTLFAWLAPIAGGSEQTRTEAPARAPSFESLGTSDRGADELAGHRRAGVDEFILAAWPHTEQADRGGELMIPRVRDRLHWPPWPKRVWSVATVSRLPGLETSNPAILAVWAHGGEVRFSAPEFRRQDHSHNDKGDHPQRTAV